MEHCSWVFFNIYFTIGKRGSERSAIRLGTKRVDVCQLVIKEVTVIMMISSSLCRKRKET